MAMSDSALRQQLYEWRGAKARQQNFSDDYKVFPNATLTGLVEQRPNSPAALLSVKGLGPERVRKYGDEILAIIRKASGESRAVAVGGGPKTSDIPHANQNAYKVWTSMDINKLEDLYEEGRSVKAMAAMLGRSSLSIEMELAKLGLPLPPHDSAKRKYEADAGAAAAAAGPQTPAKRAAR